MNTATVATLSPPSLPVSAPVVQIEHLEHAFGEGDLRKQILFDINLTIREGEIVILTGPSGSGKTTLLTLIGCLRSVQKGSLQVLGQELNGASQATQIRLRRHIGIFFRRTISWNFSPPAKMCKWPWNSIPISAPRK